MWWVLTRQVPVTRLLTLCGLAEMVRPLLVTKKSFGMTAFWQPPLVAIARIERPHRVSLFISILSAAEAFQIWFFSWSCSSCSCSCGGAPCLPLRSHDLPYKAAKAHVGKLQCFYWEFLYMHPLQNVLNRQYFWRSSTYFRGSVQYYFKDVLHACYLRSCKGKFWKITVFSLKSIAYTPLHKCWIENISADWVFISGG